MGIQIVLGICLDLFPYLESALLAFARAALSLAKTFLPLMDNGPLYALIVP